MIIYKLFLSGYRKYKRDSINTITKTETKQFIVDYIEGFASKADEYLCFFHSEKSDYCKNYKHTPAVHHRFKTHLIESAFVISKLASITP